MFTSSRDFCYFRQQHVFSEHQRGKFLPRIFHAPPATQGLAVRSLDFLCCGVDGLARDFCYFGQQQAISEHDRGKFLPGISHAPRTTQGLAARS